MQDVEPDSDAPPGTAAAEQPATVAPTAPVVTEPQKKLPAALLARLKQRGVLKEGAPLATRGSSSSTSATESSVPAALWPGGLPAGWHTAVDPTYGNHPYWFNLSTGERRWTPPDGAAMVATGGAATAAVGCAVAAAGVTPGPVGQAPAAAADVPLPAGWKAAVDTATGVTYYYNVKLNTQQWERPGIAGAAVATGAAASVGDDQGPFVASKAFSGGKFGYVFKKGGQGLGYYRCAYNMIRKHNSGPKPEFSRVHHGQCILPLLSSGFQGQCANIF